MEKLYVFGHMNPDSDSVCAAITLANLKRHLGINAEERVLGDINKETEFILNYFKVKPPKYLNDVKLKIKDINYRKGLYMGVHDSVQEVYNYMLKESTTGVPIVDEDKKLVNLITAKDILNKLLKLEDNTLDTSYENILNTLNGKTIVKATKEIKGTLKAVAFAHSTFENKVVLDENSCLIVGDRHYIIDLAIRNKVKLIIVVGNSKVKKEHIDLARKNKVNIISTPLNTFETSRIIMYSNYISKILNEKEPYIIHENDYYTDFEEWSRNIKIDNYPVLDKNGICKGLLRKSEINKLKKKQVVLVDHNESEQSAHGLEEAKITEIVDHHKIGKISTSSPINFRNMIVGSTNTIIYFIYKENGVKITKQIAGLMLSGIISDTLMFKSPTTTEIDKKVVNELNKICKLNLEKYSKEMFRKGTVLEGTIKEIIGRDLKTFTSGDTSFTVSQVFTMDYEEILNKKEEYLNEIEEKKQDLKTDHFIFLITDIIQSGSYILTDKDTITLARIALNNSKLTNGTFLKNVVSRKKQIVPLFIDILEK